MCLQSHAMTFYPRAGILCRVLAPCSVQIDTPHPTLAVTPFWFSKLPLAVQRELFVLGWRNLMPHALGQAVMTVLVVAGAWGTVDASRLTAWGACGSIAVVIVLVIRLLYRRAVNERPVPVSVLHQWRWVHLAMLLLLGLIWGALGLLLVSGNGTHNGMIIAAFAGVLAYSAMSIAPNDLTSWGLGTLPSAVGIMVLLPDGFGEQAVYVIAMLLLLYSSLLVAAWNARVTLVNSIELQLKNEALARANAEIAQRAEQANRDKSAFMAAASHDLRQPVHALLLLIEAFRQQNPMVANHPLMTHISAAGQSIRGLFMALMELSKLESGSEKPLLAPFDLRESMVRAVASATPNAEGEMGQCVRVRLRYPCSLERVALHSDKLLVERMIGNLLSNAIKYTERGGVLLAARRRRDGGYLLQVWDTGLGISDEDQARIFDPYVQVGNRERDRSRGLGLGLAIVRHTAALLNVQVGVRSRLGCGSCFSLTFPAALFAEAVPVHTGGVAMPIPSNFDFSGRRILLIEDDSMVRQSMQALLQQGWGIDLRCAARSDASVFDICGAQWTPECIISDFRLPGAMDGINLLDQLIEHFPRAAGILQTGELAEAVKARAEEAGYLVLSKPVDGAILAATLNSVLQPRAED